MELKISVKTILLFTALFILGTMILGFYSCSGGSSTPVSPQLTEEFTEEEPFDPGDVIVVTTDDGNTTTVTTPTVTTEDGTTVVTYIVTIDEFGNLIFDTRESAAVGTPVAEDASTKLFELEFTDFVPDGPVWTGTVTLTNSHYGNIHNPRLVIGDIPIDSSEDFNDFALARFVDAVQDPDIFCAFRGGFSTLITGFPTVFIADEDESYHVLIDEVAVHDISINFDGVPNTTFPIHLLYEFQPLVYGIEAESTPAIMIPRGMDIEIVDTTAGFSLIKVTIQTDQFSWDANATGFLENAHSQQTATLLLKEFNLDSEPVYEGLIEWDPAVDGPANIMAYFPTGMVFPDHPCSYLDFTTLS